MESILKDSTGDRVEGQGVGDLQKNEYEESGASVDVII